MSYDSVTRWAQSEMWMDHPGDTKFKCSNELVLFGLVFFGGVAKAGKDIEAYFYVILECNFFAEWVRNVKYELLHA